MGLQIPTLSSSALHLFCRCLAAAEQPLLERSSTSMVLGQGTQNLCSSCFSSAGFIKGATTTWTSHFCLFPCNLKRITSIVLNLKEMRMKIYLCFLSISVPVRGTTPSQGCSSSKGHKVCYREKIWAKPTFLPAALCWAEGITHCCSAPAAMFARLAQGQHHPAHIWKHSYASFSLLKKC